MILLESANRIISDTLTARFSGAETEGVELTIADFDGVTFHLTTNPEAFVSNASSSSAASGAGRDRLQLSIAMRCFDDLKQYGAEAYLAKTYGDLVAPEVEKNYNFTLVIPNSAAPADAKAKEDWIKKIALLKRNCLAAPFEKAFDEVNAHGPNDYSAPNSTQGGSLMTIHYRDEETFYIKSQADRVTLIVSTIFKEETDKVFAKVFLQEFVDARKQPSIQNAPQVLFTNREPPLELRGVKGVHESDKIGYVTFVLSTRHFSTPAIRYETISLFQNFRDYLHYHIKCSKAYMHSRMRARVADWTKVLNRAKPEIVNAEKKLASGKTFLRKV